MRRRHVALVGLGFLVAAVALPVSLAYAEEWGLFMAFLTLGPVLALLGIGVLVLSLFAKP